MKTRLSLCMILAGLVQAQSPLATQQRQSEAAPLSPKRIYLTFEDGPREGTDKVLAILKELDLKATFFVVGSNKDAAGGEKEQSDLFKQILADKHAVGNYTFTDTPATLDDYVETYGEGHFKDDAARKAFAENFEHNQTYFQQLIKPDTFVFHIARLPGNRQFADSLRNENKYLLAETRNLRLTHYSWDVEFVPNGTYPQREKSGKDLNRDWHGLAVAATIEKDAWPRNNDVLLFHDHHWDCDANAESLRAIFKLLKEQHYEFATCRP